LIYIVLKQEIPYLKTQKRYIIPVTAARNEVEAFYKKDIRKRKEEKGKLRFTPLSSVVLMIF
jgi:hypothetical protein